MNGATLKEEDDMLHILYDLLFRPAGAFFYSSFFVYDDITPLGLMIFSLLSCTCKPQRGKIVIGLC